MSNKTLNKRGDVAHWTKLTPRLQVKARVLAAAEGISMVAYTGELLRQIIVKEFARYEANPDKYSSAGTKPVVGVETVPSKDDLEAHWTALPIPVQKNAKELAKARHVRLSAFTGDLLTTVINKRFATFLVEQNALD